ncbi:VPLPA-CTERM sorting domain-containing protein [Salipiger sp.]|uniref:VPLPA-CTERM sorting domain-containing protein n=1 Tax=Salipiger sp. TaxID=2078585 RepID=UPI003A9700B7
MALTTGMAQAATLYGVSLNGAWRTSDTADSLLYEIDPTTGAGTLIGDLGYDVNSIAVDPVTGIMYASTTAWSGEFNGLLRVDTRTGVATRIGAFGRSFSTILGLTFDSTGRLFGWHEPNEDDAVLIDTATGAASRVGNSGVVTYSRVVAVDASDNLLTVMGATDYDIDRATGAATTMARLTFDPGMGGASFGPDGMLWAPQTRATVQDAVIRVSDLSTNSYRDIDTDIQYLSAVTWNVSSTVPLPATLPMLLAALGGLGIARRLRRRRGT